MFVLKLAQSRDRHSHDAGIELPPMLLCDAQWLSCSLHKMFVGRHGRSAVGDPEEIDGK